MLPSVRNAFSSFTTIFEGATRWLYLDRLGFCTTALGDLADPISLAVSLPWVLRGSNVPATRLQIIAEWNRVKAMQAHAGEGGGYGSIFERTAVLWLTPDGVNTIVDRKLDENDKYLTKSFPGFAEWAADAQLGLHSMAWAMGPAFRPRYPHFAAAVDALDFQTAAGPPGDATDPRFRGQAWMNTDHRIVPVDAKHPYGEVVVDEGQRKRNLATKTCYQNAVVVLRDKMDEDTLYWPQALV